MTEPIPLNNLFICILYNNNKESRKHVNLNGNINIVCRPQSHMKFLELVNMNGLDNKSQ